MVKSTINVVKILSLQENPQKQQKYFTSKISTIYSICQIATVFAIRQYTVLIFALILLHTNQQY